jgi:hypothetical protein
MDMDREATWGDCDDGDICPRVFESTDGEHDVVLQGYEDVEPMPLATAPAGERQVRMPRATLLRLAAEVAAQEPLRPGRLTEGFRRSLFRLELLQEYRVEAEAERFRAFREGRPMPPRKSTAWLDHVRKTIAAGARWQRVHVVSRPLSDYLWFELAGYEESAALGYETLIAERAGDPRLEQLVQDFYLLDDEVAILMRYDEAGRYLGSWRTRDREVVATCRRHREIALAGAVPLHAYLDRVAGERPATMAVPGRP